MCILYCFFFFKQKTAYEIKECDWSSDVCSSDLLSKVVADTMDENANPYILALRSSLRAAGPQPFSDTQTLSEHLESFKSKLVLVIDQGEELFLKYDLHWKKRYDFFRQLEAALDK